MKLHDKQREMASSRARFIVCRAGRKGGKTAYEVEKISVKATFSASKLKLTKTKFPSGRKVLYIAPTQTQARSIIWESLKNRLFGIAKFNEQLLQAKVPNEDGEVTTIYVGGWENRENYRGLTDVVHITFDEVDTLREFFISWLEIFRPMFLDTGGSADFIGTPKKENPNLKRLEKDFEAKGEGFESFHFTSRDNPFLAKSELDALEKEYENDRTSYQQEILAEYVDNQGSLFKYDSLVDVFTNTIVKDNKKYLIVDVADDGSDKTIFSFWEGLEEYRREGFHNLSSEMRIQKVREYCASEMIPMSHVVIDAIGVGSADASSSLLAGCVGFKSSYAPIKTDVDIVGTLNYTKEAKLVSDFKNLRSQCIFTLSSLVNTHQIASRVTGKQKEVIIEELFTYQDESIGDGKKMATPKEKVKILIGRSPDDSDTWIMRMYFVIRDKMMPEQNDRVKKIIQENFIRNANRQKLNSNK